MTITDIATPALLVDETLLDLNIREMAGYAERHGKKLRPHAKAHKCLEIAKRQVAAGAVGVCVATVAEAEMLARGGIADLLLTSPVADTSKCERMAAVAKTGARVAVVVDHVEQVQLYATAADEAGVQLDVLVDLDIGDHRTGVAPGGAALELAKVIVSHRDLSFKGLQAYSVKASHMSQQEGRGEFSAKALDQALHTKQLLENEGIESPEITGGSTGSYFEDATLPYVTELQAGSYPLMDVAYARIGVAAFRHALTVLTTVVSANQSDRVTVDAGFKALATDRPFGPDVMYIPGARFGWAGDEFGYVFLDRTEHRVCLGDRLRLIPPHCDPNVNLYDRIYLCDGDEVKEVWSVMDRHHGS